MKQEEKELLLRDLCARLPYGVKGYVNGSIQTLQGVNVLDSIVEYDIYCNTDIEEFTLYLFPLSRMTKEQKVIYGDLCYAVMHSLVWDTQVSLNELVDWLNKNHFDYRGLIEKGLAIDATNLNVY